MRWRGGRRSSNIEDRRGMRVGGGMFGGRGGFGGGLGGGLGRGGGIGRGGIGGIGLVILIVAALFFGVDPAQLFQGTDDRAYAPVPGAQSIPEDDEQAQFVSAVLADTEDTWHALFAERGATYQEPQLVLFSGAVQSACGFAQAAVGPFYCPADRRVYLDLSFFRDLERRFGAEGDFAQAYVIAHEVGHHVQTLLGISQDVAARQARAGEADANELSVRLELQADCFAGAWANHADQARQILESGDVEEALTAASAIGDDRLQMQARGYVVPESFTHGSAEQRARWFRRGLDSGRLEDCDTFGAAAL